jgi:hypothetical protein
MAVLPNFINPISGISQALSLLRDRDDPHLTQGEPGPQVDYAADRAAFSSSRSFSAAILFQCFAIRSKNFRSSELLVFEAYHSHWRAFSAHSAKVIARPRLGATLRTQPKCLLRNAYVTGITGLSKA